MPPNCFELNNEARTHKCPVLPDFLPSAADCRAAGTARGPGRRQGESTAHALCHFFCDFMQVIGTFTGRAVTSHHPLTFGCF